MTKEQFIMELEQCLQGEVSAYELSDSLTYYRQYFEDEMQNGKSEQQVIEELGSPRLIARSIIDARGIEEGNQDTSDYRDDTYGSRYTQKDSSYNEYDDGYRSNREDIGNSEQDGPLQSAGKMIRTIIISALIFFIVLFLLRALLPLAVVIIAVVLIVRLIRE